ncbi:unnamed protein product [Peronospora belbahrii]|uniref:Uncharacterized protein n=1 Tax=Peronospora belbahrii TaxID=622444 RepID=A0ABN8CYX7_9STRA|nr:unnamed protein product [Peronospora belbahrii]
MVMVEICGIPIDFPFLPYNSHVIYMEKTLCFLYDISMASTAGTSQTAVRNAPKRPEGLSLAYEGDSSDSEALQLSRIIYSSRTHLQLKQVVQELKNTSYRPIIAEHLCVNEKVSKCQGIKQNLACRSTCKDRRTGDYGVGSRDGLGGSGIPTRDAHNVESIASEAASSSFSSNDIVAAFQRGLNNVPVSLSVGFTKPGEYIFECFEQYNVNFKTCPLVLSTLRRWLKVVHGGGDSHRAASKLDSMFSFLGTICQRARSTI